MQRPTIHFSRRAKGCWSCPLNRAARPRRPAAGDFPTGPGDRGNRQSGDRPGFTRDAEARGERLGSDAAGADRTRRQRGSLPPLWKERNPRAERPLPIQGQWGLGEIFSQGPGWMRGELADRPGQEVLVRWGQQFQLQPYEEQHAASLSGEVELNYSGIGNLKAGEVHCWLFEIPAVPGIVGGPRSSSTACSSARARGGQAPPPPPPAGSGPFPGSGSSQGDRILPRGMRWKSIHRIFGGVNRMEVWLKEPGRPAGAPAASACRQWSRRAGGLLARRQVELRCRRLEVARHNLQRRFRVAANLCNPACAAASGEENCRN